MRWLVTYAVDVDPAEDAEWCEDAREQVATGTADLVGWDKA